MKPPSPDDLVHWIVELREVLGQTPLDPSPDPENPSTVRTTRSFRTSSGYFLTFNAKIEESGERYEVFSQVICLPAAATAEDSVACVEEAFAKVLQRWETLGAALILQLTMAESPPIL